MHIPVLKKEVIKYLNIKDNGIYVDLTLGRGGHAQEILKKIPNGLLIGFDKDIEAINYCNSCLSKISNNFLLIHSDFRNLKKKLFEIGINKVDGILADLGVSSPQIDIADRGFSYSLDGELDMRMDIRETLDAKIVVNEYPKEKLISIFNNYADEKKFASQITNAIIKNRPIYKTLELVEIIKNSLPSYYVRKKNPAKKIFQAIRIEVNDELNSLKCVLEDSLDLLNINGSFLVITFHSLEDKIVKNFFGNLIKSKIDPKMPINEIKNYKVKTIYPTNDEIIFNKRSKSSKLRILTKIND